MRQCVFLGVVIWACLIVGCSSHKFVRSEFESQVGKVKPYYKERDIQKNFEKRVNLPKPFSIAVFFQSPKNTHSTKAAWRWNLKDKEVFIKKMKQSLDRSLVSQIFLMDDFNEDMDLYDIRLAASKYGADSVLVLQAATDTVRQPTKWAASYALIVPMLFVNGSQAQAYFTINASLWDVRNEMLYLSTNAEGEMVDKYPLIWRTSDSAYIQKTKDLAMAQLVEEIPQDFSVLQPKEKIQ